ncbi:MAG: ABC transporter ATP-binding protein [Firmicutes bacterium]|nr:ABC transporter ATP-binding protein [Bacillota bacterium]
MINLKDITKIYKTGKIEFKALKGVSLNVDKGDFLSIIGPSGSGKSTFMNIIGCLDIPTDGKYYFEDTDISKYSKNALAEIRNKKIGFIFQKFNLLTKLSAFENVELPLIYRGVDTKERHKKVKKALENVGLYKHKDHKPTELSGGQQQRVAIARALVGKPPLILADEPTGNLDSKSEEEVMDIIKNLNSKGSTIVLITHDLEVAKNADRMVSIKDGMIYDERMK